MKDSADEGKKQLLLRLSKSLWQDLSAWAADDFRSVNGQIEYLLSEAVRRRRRSTDSRPDESTDESSDDAGAEAD